MSYPSGLDIARGIVTGARAIRQYGRNPAVSSTFVPLTRGGIYRTPQVGAQQALRIRAGGNANDTAAGSGAREITLVGLDATGEPITDTIATNGTSASAVSSKQFLRLTDAFVSKSGTYATQTALSHAATINIEDGAGNLWAVIQDTDIPRGDTEIGAYSVPVNRSLYISHIRLQSDEANKTNVVMFKRSGILQTAAPYDGMQLIAEFPSLSGTEILTYDPPIRIEQLSDVGFLAKSNSGTIDVSVGFDGFEVRP
jgi:hypothetical protein